VIDLLRAKAAPAAARWGTTVTAATDVGQTVEVSFDGSDTESYDFVVAADGVRSAGRTSIFGGGGSRAAVLSAASWRFVTSNPGMDCWCVWSGADGTLLLIPVAAEQVCGYASATRGGPVGPDPHWLWSTFGDDPQPVRRAVSSALADPSSLYHSPVEEVRPDSWHRGRVVLGPRTYRETYGPLREHVISTQS
jgi:2-polyprenyl-6-methoxyphenol hydroxylase-like FAD-dependent oxidoreductase